MIKSFSGNFVSGKVTKWSILWNGKSLVDNLRQINSPFYNIRGFLKIKVKHKESKYQANIKLQQQSFESTAITIFNNLATAFIGMYTLFDIQLQNSFHNLIYVFFQRHKHICFCLFHIWRGARRVY